MASRRRVRKTEFAIFSGYEMSPQAFMNMVAQMPALRSRPRELYDLESCFWLFTNQMSPKPRTSTRTRTRTRRRTRQSPRSSFQPVISTTRANPSLKISSTHHSHKRRRKTRPAWHISLVAFTMTAVAWWWILRDSHFAGSRTTIRIIQLAILGYDKETSCVDYSGSIKTPIAQEINVANQWDHMKKGYPYGFGAMTCFVLHLFQRFQV
ncbi:hypothetical protein CPB85DRAFT_591088 [Mucidula mucida]|nr:hypothetical protein CPB85DRAFT_591088 [Mucidula mucida]